MSLPNIGGLRAVSDRLDQLDARYAFVGGSIVNLLLDDPQLSPTRPTDDVDVILEVLTSERYSEVEAKLRNLGFAHDTRQGAPLCRWLLGALVVDIMPTQGTQLGLNTAWFPEALATATWIKVADTRLPLISPVAFLATKYVAFHDRGNADYYGSHDLEDFITVIDGRDNIVTEIADSSSPLREYVVAGIKELIGKAAFNEAVPGHLPGDSASQGRLPFLRTKLAAIAKLRRQ